MATEPENTTETEEASEETPTKKRFNLSSKKVKVLVLLVVVMGVQLVGLYLFLPSSTNTSNADDENGGEGSVETVEVTIDTFTVDNALASPGHRLSVSFKLTAAIAINQEVDFDQAANKEHKEMIRDAVGQIVGDSSLEELNDPRRSVIRRKLKERINKDLGKSYVQRIFVSGFRVIDQ